MSKDSPALRCALLGERLGHSYSKEIHERIGLYGYDLCEVARQDLGSFVETHLRAPLSSDDGRPYAGINVTIPYKQAIIPYLDEVDALATSIGAVNTVYRRRATDAAATDDVDRSEMLVGSNTDYFGFLYMLRMAGLSLAGKHVLILGSGGASAMIQYACLHGDGVAATTDSARSVTVVSRHPQAAGTRGHLATEDGPLAVRFCDYDHLPEETQILINTTPVGTYPEVESSPIDLSDAAATLPRLEGVVDLIYNPLRTTLLLQAEERGLPAIGGLNMLVGQAVAASRLFVEGDTARAPREADPDSKGSIGQLCEELHRETQNIVLIGMPGSGKTSLGKDIAKRTGRTFRDSDKEIFAQTGRRPAEIIREDGEDAFRRIESGVIATLAKEHGLVIATGGGVVERKENMTALRRNGYFLYLKKRLAALATKDRPLSQDMDALKALQARRAPLYEKVADLVVDNNRYYQDTLQFVLRHI